MVIKIKKKKKLDSFDKFYIIYSIGFIFLFFAIFTFIFGFPNLSPIQKYREFCWSEGGDFIERSIESHNEDLCIFSYDNKWSSYAMVKVVNEFPNSPLKKGDLCFACWDTRSCSEDSLTKLDNGRRDTRC